MKGRKTEITENEKELKSGSIKETTRIEYEWKPSKCGTCLIYGHLFDSCPKAVNKGTALIQQDADDTDSDVEDVYDETTQFMASSSKRVSGSGGANDSSLCEDGDYEMHDGYEDYAYDLTEEQKALSKACDINLHSQFRR
ncbi:hypothetical protein Tco_1201659 [Tanacetum coccineum]